MNQCSIGLFQISAHANIPFLLPEFATVAPFLENDFPDNDENQTTLLSAFSVLGSNRVSLSMLKWAVRSSFKWKIWLPIGLRLFVDVLGPNPKHDVLVDVLAHQSFKTTRGSVA